ncbi:MAG: hypothetical protein GXP54_11805, partial [Deltaproteobacteria bacterium]|nr:hypothetical protein [Deltaproteobacteria bacterium]
MSKLGMDASGLRVALVAPPMDFMRELYGFRGQKVYRNQMPLGIGFIAAVLREAGHRVFLFDCAAQGWDIETSVRHVLDCRPDVIGVTSISMEAPSAYALIRALKSQSDVFCVLGGSHANSFYKEIPEQCPELDAIVVGEGEYTMAELCDRIESGGGLDSVAGLVHRREDGTFSAFRERPLVADLDDL